MSRRRVLITRDTPLINNVANEPAGTFPEMNVTESTTTTGTSITSRSNVRSARARNPAVHIGARRLRSTTSSLQSQAENAAPNIKSEPTRTIHIGSVRELTSTVENTASKVTALWNQLAYPRAVLTPTENPQTHLVHSPTDENKHIAATRTRSVQRSPVSIHSHSDSNSNESDHDRASQPSDSSDSSSDSEQDHERHKHGRARVKHYHHYHAAIDDRTFYQRTSAVLFNRFVAWQVWDANFVTACNIALLLMLWGNTRALIDAYIYTAETWGMPSYAAPIASERVQYNLSIWFSVLDDLMTLLEWGYYGLGVFMQFTVMEKLKWIVCIGVLITLGLYAIKTTDEEYQQRLQRQARADRKAHRTAPPASTSPAVTPGIASAQ